MAIFERIKAEREEKRRKAVEQLEDKVLLAEEVRSFFDSDLGKSIKSQMEADCESLLKDLAKLFPFDANKILETQSQYHAIKRLQAYFGRLLVEGENAYQALQQQNNRDE